MNGILNINKPSGATSYQIVAMVKRLSGERKVGHAGTLDPDATGVLPVFLGKATRVIEYLLGVSKTYLAEIELGITTDTYDASGQVTIRRDASAISQTQVTKALATFSGLIWQTPPMYSALKYRGTRLYHLARAGIVVDRPSRPTQVHRIELQNFEPPIATVEIECGKGTYIRSLAQDLGELLNCGAHLKSLVRLKYGPFHIDDSISVTRIEEAIKNNDGVIGLYPMEMVLSHLPSVVVTDEQADSLKHGHYLDVETVNKQIPAGEPQLRVYTSEGHLLGLWHFDPERNQYQPKKVLASD